MKLSISNIAWDVNEDAQVAQLLKSHKIGAIDIAPGKYFPNPAEVKPSEISKVKAWWFDHGISIVGMQALLFGTKGLNVFGGPASQDAMLKHLTGVCKIGEGLGATRLTFGSPKNRDRTGLTDQEVEKQAMSFFRRLGDNAKEHGVTICLEPNPTSYGANFMTTSYETAQMIDLISHPAIRMQFDTGAVAINAEDAEDVLKKHAAIVGHIHASEPELAPLGDKRTDHAQIFHAVQKYLPKHYVTIEMVATPNEPHLKSVERALRFAQKHYGGDA